MSELAIVKAGRPLIDMVELCYTAGLPLMLVGRHGIGKSELLKQAAGEMDRGYIVRDLSLMEPTDLVGLPRAEGEATHYLPPAFLPRTGSGLLVFEELNRCPGYMRAPCLQLLTQRTLNDYTLPPGWLPMAAINPPESGYDAEELYPALLSRFVRVAVEPDHEEWLAWARNSGIHTSVITYVREDPTLFDGPENNPRAWAGVSKAMWASERIADSRKTLHAVIAGLVGLSRATAFLSSLDGRDRPLTADALLAYDGHRDRVRGWIAGGRLDLVSGSLLALQKRLQAKGNYEEARDNPSAWGGLARLLGDLPGDLREELQAFFDERGYALPPTRKGA
jgi:hypothetical protein